MQPRAPMAEGFVERGRGQEVAWERLDGALARPDGRRILILCGSRLSHACHVLDEQLDDEARARPLARFRAVRVDADDEPDVDLALQALAGHRVARWPIWALLSPTGAPLLVSARLDPAEPALLGDGVRDPLLPPRFADGTAADHRHALERRRDARLGGFLPTPKLLPWPALAWLVRSTSPTKQIAAEQIAAEQIAAEQIDWAAAFVERTLVAVAQGGLFDPLGGGVHAASVDERWVVPLYEKRALDQAAALDGLTAFADARLSTLRDEVAQFCVEQLMGEDGAFASGLDADSGPYDHAAFYTFSEAEARQALPPEVFAVGQRYFDLYGRGELPSSPTRNVLYRALPPAQLAAELGLPEPEVERQIAVAKTALAAAQSRRARPPRDETLQLDAAAALARALLPTHRAVALGALDRLYAICDDAPAGSLPHRVGAPGAPGEWLGDVVALGRAALAAHALTGEAHHLTRAVSLHSRLPRFFAGAPGQLGAVPPGSGRWAAPYVTRPLVDATSPSLLAQAARFCFELAPHHPGAARDGHAICDAHERAAFGLGVEGCGLLTAREEG